MADNTPIYNLKAVINEVGLNPATLRAWERRYELFKPQRTPGGHRLYSRQEIETLKWLIERQKDGLSISSAVEMWKSQQKSQIKSTQPIHAPFLVSGTGGTMLDELRDAWMAACLDFDDLAANQTLDQAFSIASPETVCTEVLQKGLVQIGGGWYTGSISVQQEHFSTAIAMRRINTLLAAITTMLPARPGHILAACPPGEEHDFILLLITYLLRRRGWDMIYLGANVPLDALDATVQATSPILILSSAQTLNSAASLRSMSETIASQEVPLAFGGGIFTKIPAATKCISGYYLGSDLMLAPQIIELLIETSPSLADTQPISPEYSQTLAQLKKNEALIIAHISSAMQDEGIEPYYLEVANINLSQYMASALTLGDISFLDPEVTWLNGLLKNHGLPTGWVKQYFSSYHLAVERYLGQEGAVIQDWLTKQLLST
jgi:methanogenic corrinoid protein MtbC1